MTQLSPDRREGLKPKPEIRIPELLKMDLQAGVLKVSKSIDKYQPDLVLTLARSGPIAFEALKAYRELNGLSIPQEKSILIGQELSLRAETEDGEEIEFVDNGTNTGTKHDVNGWQEYEAWLERQLEAGDPNIVRLVQELKDLDISPAKIMIVDDCVYQGGTLYISAPWIVGKAFGETDARPECVLQDSGWYDKIIVENFPEYKKNPQNPEFIFREALRAFLKDLLKGSYDNDGEMVEIKKENIREIGEKRSREYRDIYGQELANPLDALSQKYTQEDLLSLSKVLIQEFRKIGKEAE